MRKAGRNPLFYLFIMQLHMSGFCVPFLFVIVCGVHFDSCFFIGVLNVPEVVFH